VSSLSGFSALAGAPFGAHQTLSSTRKRALAVSNTPCTDWVDAPCSGSATQDTNVPDTVRVLHPGDYLDVRFASVTGPSLGNNLVLNGRMRLDFLSAFDLDAAQFPGLDLKLTFDGFSGSVNAKPFGPITDLSRLQISTQGVTTITAGGASYTALSGITITGPGDYVVGGGTVRASYWSDAGKYVELQLQNWRVAGARPAVGSRATVTAAQGSISIVATSSATGSVVYAVSIASTTGNASYAVTATYPQGGGAPTYTAVPG
jgi:hypothetical protein